MGFKAGMDTLPHILMQSTRMSHAVILTHCLSMLFYVPGIMVIVCPYFINVARIYHGQCGLASESECVSKTV